MLKIGSVVIGTVLFTETLAVASTREAATHRSDDAAEGSYQFHQY